jgi:glycosyltransferase involved in cell wall biosynthesis
LKVIQLNLSDIDGGAARAAYRTHQALRQAGVDSRMWVDSAVSGDWTVEGPATALRKSLLKFRPMFTAALYKPLFKTGNPIIHSPAILPSGRLGSLNGSDADLLHLHWVQGEMLSISEIGRLRKPTLWTLHDMWPFCGAEHYTEEFRWREGYEKGNRPRYESRLDLNRWTWRRKIKNWQNPIHIVTPSHWLANCVRESALMRNWPVSVIHNPIDTERWRPIERGMARDLMGLPADVPLLLFGAMGGSQDPRKGFDLLRRSLKHLQGESSAKGIELVVFGQHAPKSIPDLGFPVHYTGHLNDDLSLRSLYSAADALVVPSRQDNLPNTGVEANSCGTPVVAFDVGGFRDIVDNNETGYLAAPFDTEDLAEGIKWAVSNRDSKNLKSVTRRRAIEKFSYPVIARQYREIYEKVIEISCP